MLATIIIMADHIQSSLQQMVDALHETDDT